MERLRAYLPAVRIGSGVLLILLGVLLFLGSLTRLNSALFRAAAALDTWAGRYRAGSDLIVGFVFLGLSALVGLRYIQRIAATSLSGDRSARLGVSPLRLTIVILVLSFSALSFTGLVSFPSLLSGWLRFQGI